MVTSKELLEIRKLQEICEKEESIQLKLNFEMLQNRKEHLKEDFLHYENDRLVGFLGYYDFGSKVELCGMVHPDYRRKGIFSRLLKMGLDQAKQRNTRTCLLNAPSGSQSAKAFLKTIPCEFAVAEYQMKWQETELSDDPSVTIRPAYSKEDMEAHIQLDLLCFGFLEKEAREYTERNWHQQMEQNLIIESAGQTAGKMRVSKKDGEAWIYGFAVFPELQGKGIGRKALSKVVQKEHQKRFSIFLEVEATNTHALKLYESCGFRIYHSQDYYRYLNS